MSDAGKSSGSNTRGPNPPSQAPAQTTHIHEAYNPGPIVSIVADLQRGFNPAPIAQAVQQVTQGTPPATPAAPTPPATTNQSDRG